jgi:diaminohydroxyphosphoribosylaminopyrimidine deaminase/5-amino-6-(5-phosphoribosylamino)uracil reductase
MNKEIALDRHWMTMALSLARRAWGKTSPNPMVGAIIARENDLIGEGYHRKAGMPHAEIEAFNNASLPTEGATIYITLEPCSTHGRTPPCTDAIIKHGIKRVVIGCLDPNPNHQGNGVAILKAAGVEVTVGVEEVKCKQLNESFFKWIQTGFPFVLLKMAMTLDGKIATKNGVSKWITSDVARARVQQLRKWSDAIIVGGETARNDHPSLNVRSDDDWECQPKRFVATTNLSNEELVEIMPGRPEPIAINLKGEKQWKQFLEKLGKDSVTSLLIEGGGEFAASALEYGVVDKIEFHIAPKILGGRDSRSVIGGNNPISLDNALQLSDVITEQLGCDFLISGYPNRKSYND